MGEAITNNNKSNFLDNISIAVKGFFNKVAENQKPENKIKRANERLELMKVQSEIDEIRARRESLRSKSNSMSSTANTSAGLNYVPYKPKW
mgnify:CR=1 FL=1|jgi:uncharacterized membrane protein YgaE (UPF0421/DUF939 family)